MSVQRSVRERGGTRAVIGDRGPNGSGGATATWASRGPLARETVADGLRTVFRRPARSLLSSIGTALGVGAVVAVTGISASAERHVAADFAAQEPTNITFADGEPTRTPQALTEGAVSRLAHLPGVEHAGLVWEVDGGQPLQIRKFAATSLIGDQAVPLPVTAADPGALQTMRATVSMGRLFDRGSMNRHEAVGLLGVAAAAQLHIATLQGNPAVFVGDTSVTIIGIVASVSQQAQALLGLIVPPDLATSLYHGVSTRDVIAQTERGVARDVGREGRLALAPFDPGRVSVEIPPDPVTLQNAVENSVRSLLAILAAVGFVLGAVAISNTTLLSVLDRRAEIGLRRALGYRGRDICTLILLESGLLGMLGSVVGAAVGVAVVEAVAYAQGWPAVLNAALLGGSVPLGAFTGVVAGFYPAVRALRITPLEALRTG